jgi:hypothetical protein
LLYKLVAITSSKNVSVEMASSAVTPATCNMCAFYFSLSIN